MPVGEPFDHPDFFFEVKFDGFRALAHIGGHHCQLVSRNSQILKRWPQLSEEIAHAVRAHSAVLDGETDLLFGREWPYFVAFDVLSINGKDLRDLPLHERKRRLARIMPWVESRLILLEPIERHGRRLFELACERDLEGIVAKWKHGTCQSDGRGTSWFKVKVPSYSQRKVGMNCLNHVGTSRLHRGAQTPSHLC